MENQNKQNIDAKAEEVREKLEDETLDKCKVEGAGAGSLGKAPPK